jgi:hypothetical protein
MIAGFRNPPSASRSRVRTLPSQVKRKFNAALNTVGVLNGSSDPLAPRSRAFALAPFVPVSWHEPQLSVLSSDKRGSRNNCSPSATRRGSSRAGAGIGVIGSAPGNDGTVWAAAINAPANKRGANKDTFRPRFGAINRFTGDPRTLFRRHRVKPQFHSARSRQGARTLRQAAGRAARRRNGRCHHRAESGEGQNR